MTASTVRNVDRFDTGRGSPSSGGDGLRLGERVMALREQLEARADSRAAAQLRTDVREARDYVRGFEAHDVSERTQGRYDQVVGQMREAGQRPEDASCRNSFEFRRAALVHVTRTELKTALRDLDKHRRAGGVESAAEAYSRVRSGLNTLRRYPPSTGSREADMARRSVYQGPSRTDPERSNGKRSSLVGLPDDWRDTVQREVRDKDKVGVAVMALTGCRPAEVRGVRVRQDADGTVSLTVRGAKVDEARGIESRTVIFDRDELAKVQAGRDLMDWVGSREQRTVSHPGTVEAFCERVSRAADRAGLHQVSAYTYRHASARDLKSAGTPRGEIAERLGHRSDRSQSVYG
ncbi:site-specific integrase [Paraburkholderia sp. BL21I4N1]|uniref:site-specific integrase n=1 Tax=Paraburkholderia sp. BL21I4N1 TaxID=1938801 RepID=UPI000CFD8753|nr:site-specific integrase [Paraburkholderia sp. BL21I4N1]PQV45824.1 phage integrase family protein [Paraburkholderia sp. BL21I4N1]